MVFSEASSLMIESRVSLDSAIVREVRTARGQGALFVQTQLGRKMLLRFRNRTDRSSWRRSLKFQTSIESLNREIDFTPHKRRQIYFIDGSEEFQVQIEGPKIENSISQQTSKKRKGSILENVRSKIRKVSSLVNCFGNLSVME